MDYSVSERFFKKVKPMPNGCWEWIGGKNSDGYGELRAGMLGQRLAHRISHCLFHGPLEKTEVVMHSCDNPPCVNPWHLSKGTQADNMKDMGLKKRANCPQMHQTHCLQGHEYTEGNTYLWKNRRVCKTCRKVYKATYRASLK